MTILRKIQIRRIVVLLLLVTFLTFGVGRVTHVSAVATTVGVVTAALIGTGAVYMGYLALTGADISIPTTNIDNWLEGIGRKAVEYGTTAGIYSKLINYLHGNGIESLGDYNVDFGRSDLLQFYNNFKDIYLNKEIMSFTEPLSIVYPGLPIDYYTGVTMVQTPYNRIRNDIGYPNGQIYSLEYLESQYLTDIGTGTRIALDYYTDASEHVFYTVPLNDTGTFRNYKYQERLSNGTYVTRYKVQKLVDNSWVDTSTLNHYITLRLDNGDIYGYINPYNYNTFHLTSVNQSQYVGTSTFPRLPDVDIYDSLTGEVVEAGTPVDIIIADSPNWPANTPDPDDENNSIIPFVPYVELPSNNNWGFNLGDWLAEIINRSGQIISASALGDLINAFKNSLNGTQIYNDYSYYNNGDTYYIDYYSNTYQGDYNIYNIDVSEYEDIIPVDLNTIQQYTTNEYLTQVKENAVSFGSVIGDWFVFWNNSDPVLTYTILGGAIMLLLGAFIGKWGHS